MGFEIRDGGLDIHYHETKVDTSHIAVRRWHLVRAINLVNVRPHDPV